MDVLSCTATNIRGSSQTLLVARVGMCIGSFLNVVIFPPAGHDGARNGVTIVCEMLELEPTIAPTIAPKIPNQSHLTSARPSLPLSQAVGITRSPPWENTSP